MDDMVKTSREFLRRSLYFGAAALAVKPIGKNLPFAAETPKAKMKFGLVTYLWARDWNLPTLIANCEKTGFLGVELHIEHAHGVEPNLIGFP